MSELCTMRQGGERERECRERAEREREVDVHRADAREDDAPLCEVDTGVERDAVLEQEAHRPLLQLQREVVVHVIVAVVLARAVVGHGVVVVCARSRCVRPRKQAPREPLHSHLEFPCKPYHSLQPGGM